MEISIFRNVFDSSNPFKKDVFYALDRIKNGRSKEKILLIRKGEKEKTDLSGVCFNGCFKYRNEKGLIKRSGLIILDFDKVGKDEVIKFKETISKDQYTFACWISPSGDGLKVLVKIPLTGEFISYFNALKDYYNSDYFDISNKDIPRFCFESYDPDLFLNKESILWDKQSELEIEDFGVNSSSVVVPISSTNKIVDNLLTWWKKKYSMVKGQRNNNLFKLAAAFNNFGISKSDAEHEFLKFNDYISDKEILSIVNSAYKKVSDFGIKFFEDALVKNKIETLVKSGRNKKDIISELENVDSNIVDKAIDLLKKEGSPDEFWKYDKNGKIQLSPHQYKYWLEQNNFGKYFPTKSNTYTFVKINEAKVEETNEKRIKDFVLSELISKKNIIPYDFMANNQKYFTSDFLSLLESKNIEIKKDTKEICFIYFENKIIEIKKDSIRLIDYEDIGDTYVWKKQIINRKFLQSDHHESEFRKFIWLIAGKDISRYNSFKSVIGYLLHSHKTSSNNQAIILNDETISENPNGGSGKGIFTNALSYMKKIASIDGKTFEFNKSFPYQTVSTDTQVLVFDDVKKNFNFESLFSLITEGITLEYKGQDAIKLPIEESPKILISTNYTIGGVGGSFERRKFEVELSNYFNFKYSPVDEFGHLLFDEWTEEEWHRFDNYMIQCVQFYLKNGLISQDFKNLETRKFIKNTSFEFYEWVKDSDNIPFNIRIGKTEIYNKFIDDFQDFKKWLTNKKFKKWVEYYCDFHNFKYTEANTNGVRWFCVTKSETEQMPDANDKWI